MIMEYQETVVIKQRIIDNLADENALLKQKYGVKQ